MHATYKTSNPSETKKNLRFLAIMFLLTTLGGAVRKWGFSVSLMSNLIFAVQLISPFFIYFFKKVPNSNEADNYKKIADVLKPYSILLILCAVNPLNQTIYHGILGFVIHIGFWVIVLIYLQFRNWFPFEKLFYFFLILSIGQFVLGALQYTLPPDHVLNKYLVEGELDEIGFAQVGDAVRVTGTFSYITGFTSYIVFYTFFICACIENSHFNKVLLGILITLGIYACFISGSRGITAFYVITIFAYFIFSSDLIQTAKIVSQILIGLAFIVLVNVGLSDPLSSGNRIEQAYSNFESRVESNKEEGSGRGTEFIDAILDYNGPSPIFGIGLGTCYQGANAIFGFSPYLKGMPPPENELWKTIFEGGYILLFVKFFLFFRLFYNTVINKGFILIVILLIFSTIPIAFNVYNLMYTAFGICYLDKITWLKKQSQGD